MDDNIERVCSGLRQIAKEQLPQPDFLLATEQTFIPEKISGIPVIISPTAFYTVDHGTTEPITYLPCYLVEKHRTGKCIGGKFSVSNITDDVLNYQVFQAYKKGWDS